MIRRILEAIAEKELHPSADLTGGPEWRGVDPGIKKAVEELEMEHRLTPPAGIPSEQAQVMLHVPADQAELLSDDEKVDVINDVGEWMEGKDAYSMPEGITGASLQGGKFDPILLMWPGEDQLGDLQDFWMDVVSAADKVRKVVSWYGPTGTETHGEIAGPYVVALHGANFDNEVEYSTYELAKAAGQAWLKDARANNPGMSDEEFASEFGWTVFDSDGNEVDEG